jgi:hypothetical protein
VSLEISGLCPNAFQMLAAVERRSRVLLVRRPLPRSSPGWVLIRARPAGFCKTDSEILRGYHNFQGTAGHEFVGEVMILADYVHTVFAGWTRLSRMVTLRFCSFQPDGGAMHLNTQFAHVLLFACPRCARPLASACINSKRSLEDADAHWFNPHCHCGWTGDVSGVSAVKHWVEPWELVAPMGKGVPGSCDGEVNHEVNRYSDQVA